MKKECCTQPRSGYREGRILGLLLNRSLNIFCSELNESIVLTMRFEVEEQHLLSR